MTSWRGAECTMRLQGIHMFSTGFPQQETARNNMTCHEIGHVPIEFSTGLSYDLQ